MRSVDRRFHRVGQQGKILKQGRPAASGGAEVIPLAARHSDPSFAECRPSGTHPPFRASKTSSFVVYRWDGTPKSEWLRDGDRPGGSRGPTHIRHRPDGSRIECWYRESRLHRADGPALIERAASGRILSRQWWIEGRNITAVAETFIRETGARWPLDPGHQSILLCRQLVSGEGSAAAADRLGWRSILTALRCVAPFWLLLGLSIALFR